MYLRKVNVMVYELYQSSAIFKRIIIQPKMKTMQSGITTMEVTYLKVTVIQQYRAKKEEMESSFKYT